MKRVSALLLTGFLFTSGSLALSQPIRRATRDWAPRASRRGRREVRAAAAGSGLDPRIQQLLDVRAPGLGVVAPDGSGSISLGHHRHTAGVSPRSAEGLSEPDDRRRGAHHADAVTPDGKWLVLSRDTGGRKTPACTSIPRRRAAARVSRSRRFRRISSSSARTAGALLPRERRRARQLRDLPLRHRERQRDARLRREGAVADCRSQAARRRLAPPARQDAELARAGIRRVRAGDEEAHAAPRCGRGVEYHAVYAAQPGELLVGTNKFRDFRHLYRWKIGGDGSRRASRGAGARRDGRRRGTRSTRRAATSTSELTTAAMRASVCSMRRPSAGRRPAAEGRGARHRGLDDARRTLRHARRRDRAGAARSYVWDWQTEGADAVGRAVHAGDGPRRIRDGEAHDVSREGRHADPDVRALPEGCAPDENPTRPCPVVVEFHGGPEVQARPGFSPYARCSSMRATSWSSPTCAAATATARRGWTPTTARSASTSSGTSRTPEVDPRERGPQRQGAARRRDGRQLRRLLNAGCDDDVRRHVRRGGCRRRHQQSRNVPQEHGGLSAHPAHLRVRRPGQGRRRAAASSRR